MIEPMGVSMIEAIHRRFSIHSNDTRKNLILLSPVVVILLGQLAARILGPAIGVWSWIPLNIGYWTAIILLIKWGGDRPAIRRWLRPSQGHWLWPVLTILVAVVPTVPMLFPDTWRLFLQVEVCLPTLFFVLINPCVEEAYWRGLLLDVVENKNKWLGILYSSTLFMINHMWISVMVIGARNPMASVFQFMFGVLMSIAYLKTQSLRWPLVAHFLVNLLTPTVAVFLNLYIPGMPG
jgi:membrane protease YdiL (CAAX protease family)